MTQLTIDDICSSRHRGNEHSQRANPTASTKRRTQKAVLEVIRRRGGATLKEIAAELDTFPNCISGRISELKQAGVIVTRGRRGRCGINFISDTSEGDSFLNQSSSAGNCCLMVSALSSSHGLPELFVGVLIFLFTASVVPCWGIWTCRKTLFPRYNQQIQNNKVIEDTPVSLDGLKTVNSTKATVLDSIEAETLGRAQR